MLSLRGSGKLGIYCSRIPGAMDPSLHVTRRRPVNPSHRPHGPHGSIGDQVSHRELGINRDPSIPKPGDLAGSPVDPWGPCGRCGRCDGLTGGAGCGGPDSRGQGGNFLYPKIFAWHPHIFLKNLNPDHRILCSHPSKTLASHIDTPYTAPHGRHPS